MVATIVEALAWVEIDAVDLTVTIEPDSFSSGPDRDAARAVGRSQRRDLVRRTVDQVEAVEDGVLDDRGDLIAQA
jgi:hypothetical protein